MGAFQGKAISRAKPRLPAPYKTYNDGAWTVGCRHCPIVMRRYTTDEKVAQGWMDHHRCGNPAFSTWGGIAD